MNKPELLAPAGSVEAVRTAFYFGADAVYLGGPMLQLRAEGCAFSFDDIKEAASLAHSLGKRIYVTVNCFATNDEISEVAAYAQKLYESGADAVIVSDLGVIAAIHEAVPLLPVHVSTQANCQNYKTAEIYYRLGAKRVVLGREMNLEQIEQFNRKKPEELETEVFVHGAMCMAYSGRCLISSFLTNRSGNRGDCSQPCRWNYYLIEEKRPGQHIPICEEDGATAILSSHDLNCISFLNKLENAGAVSFKIEGRMKSPYYVATVVNAYRRAIDGTADIAACQRELDSASHRPYNTGFYFGAVAKDPNNDGLYRSDCEFTGVVLGKNQEGYITEMRNRFSVGDELEILSPYSIGLSFTVKSIISEQGEQKNEAVLVQEKVTIGCPYELHAGDMLRRRK